MNNLTVEQLKKTRKYQDSIIKNKQKLTGFILARKRYAKVEKKNLPQALLISRISG